MSIIAIGVSIFTGSHRATAGADTIPSNVSLPAISGEARVGVQLICSQGTWSGSPSPTFAYQWKAAGVNVGTNANTFTPTAAEVAKVMTCQVTATNTSGNASATSPGTLPVLAAAVTQAQRWLGNEPSGMAIGFIDNSILVRDAAVPSKNFEGLATSLMGFTRNSVAYRINSAGLMELNAINDQRFNYHPITLVPLGLLLENPSTNLCLQSRSHDTAPWSHGGAVTITQNTTETLSPDGTNNASKYDSTSTGIVGYMQQLFTATGLTDVTYTWYLKAGTATSVQLEADQANQSIIVNMITGVISDATPGVVKSSTIQLSNGWWIFSFTCPASNAGADALLTKLDSVVVGTCYIWQAQIEMASAPSTAIVTTTAVASRASEVAGVSISSFSFDPSVGTLVTQPSPYVPSTSGYRYLASFNDGVNYIANLIDAFDLPAKPGFEMQNGSPQVYMTTTDSPESKCASAWALNDSAISSQGNPVVSRPVGTVPVGLTTLTIGDYLADGGFALNGSILATMHLPRRATNAELEILSVPFV